MPAAQQLSHVYPLGSRIDERGRIEIGGCDTVELAAQFGTPAYIVAEDDIRARARAFVSAFAAYGPEHEVVFASKAFPCTAIYRLLWEDTCLTRASITSRQSWLASTSRISWDHPV